MKKRSIYIIGFVVLAILSYGLWINPFKFTVTVEKMTTDQFSTYYVNTDNAPAYTCPNINCSIFGYYPKGELVYPMIPYAKPSILPDFVPFKAGNSSSTLYITKNLLSKDFVSTTPTTIFHINTDQAPLYTCPSLKCEIIGTYDLNTKFPYKANDESELPEWIKFTANNSSTTVYINKAYLSK